MVNRQHLWLDNMCKIPNLKYSTFIYFRLTTAEREDLQQKPHSKFFLQPLLPSTSEFEAPEMFAFSHTLAQ